MKWKKYWDKVSEYKRILEILDDYWIYCEDEGFVSVEMMFVKKNGECQLKHIKWKNPNLTENDKKAMKSCWIPKVAKTVREYFTGSGLIRAKDVALPIRCLADVEEEE